jgi:hypothetical protein
MQEADFKLQYSPDVQFLCKAGGVPIPFLPVARKEEYKLFSSLLLTKMILFDTEQMAKLWIGYLDGKTTSPKLPVQLKNYHREWERNRRINAQQQRAAPDLQMFNKFLRTMTRESPGEAGNDAQILPQMPQPIARVQDKTKVPA